MSESQELRTLGWCILELMGHRRLAGYVAEEALFGTVLLRIDVPGDQAGMLATQYYGGHSVYAVTPTTEDLARQVARASRPAPVSRWELPAAEGASHADEEPNEDELALDAPDFF